MEGELASTSASALHLAPEANQKRSHQEWGGTLERESSSSLPIPP
jgi:hypothetical protein